MWIRFEYQNTLTSFFSYDNYAKVIHVDKNQSHKVETSVS